MGHSYSCIAYENLASFFFRTSIHYPAPLKADAAQTFQKCPCMLTTTPRILESVVARSLVVDCVRVYAYANALEIR